MIPNMYKIAGELTSTVFHIAARALAVNGLSIFGDHSDVMACRQTGWAMLSSNNVQEVMDMALVSHAATLEARVPFLHFFDGFRTSHEVQKVEEISFEIMRKMISDDLVAAHRARGLTPEKPMIRGTAQNPDVYFSGRESANKYYDAVPAIVQKYMDQLAKLTGRKYGLYEYHGAADADRVIIVMGSGVEPVQEAVEYLNAKGEKVGVLVVRLYRPFDASLFVKAIPASVKAIAVMDRTKEPGSLGEPLYEDVRTAIGEAMSGGKSQFKNYPVIVGGRYGLGSGGVHPRYGQSRLRQPQRERAEEQIHHRHLRRRVLHLPQVGRALRPRREGRSRSPLLRTRIRRYRRRKQELHQDHRRRYRQQRAGLLCLRL